VDELVAWISYVATHLPDFRDQPLQAHYLWQDGYLPIAGMAAAALPQWRSHCAAPTR
jgi:hypothetical protein